MARLTGDCEWEPGRPTGRAGTGWAQWGPRWPLASRFQLEPIHGAGDPLDVTVINDSVALKRNISENMILLYF